MRRAGNPATTKCRLYWNLGASASWKTQGLSMPVMGLLYLWLQGCPTPERQDARANIYICLWRRLIFVGPCYAVSFVTFPASRVLRWNILAPLFYCTCHSKLPTNTINIWIVICIMIPYILLDAYRHFGGTCSLRSSDSSFIRNINNYVAD